MTEPRQQAFIIIIVCAFYVPFLRCRYYLPNQKQLKTDYKKTRGHIQTGGGKQLKIKKNHTIDASSTHGERKRRITFEMIISGSIEESHMELMQIHASFIYNITDPICT